jgi:hypothetical protein
VTTTIAYHLADHGPVKLEVYNCRGIKIHILVDQILPAGDHETELNVNHISHPGPGIYLLKLTTLTGVVTRKMLVIN